MIQLQTKDFCFYGSNVSYNANDLADDIDIYNLDLKDHFLFFINVDLITHIDCCDEQLLQLLKDYQQTASDNGKRFHIVCESIYEAPSYSYDLKKFISSICDSLGITLDEIILLTGAHDQQGAPVKAVNSLAVAAHNLIFLDTESDTLPQHHFISLARLLKSHRIAATVEILDRGLDVYGKISLGSGYYIDPEENNFTLVPKHHRHRMPLLLDGDVSGTTNPAEFKATSDAMTHAFCNLVMETSYERALVQGKWNLNFVSEKSLKPFAWGQVPLFVAPAGFVQIIKNMGFDIFEDIIDHSYDHETDPFKRITMVIDCLAEICGQDISHWQQYKENNQSRFDSNRQIAMKINNDKNRITRDNLWNAIIST
jgi:hypothetical protein